MLGAMEDDDKWEDLPWLLPSEEQMEEANPEVSEMDKPPIRERSLVKLCKRCRHWKRKTEYYDTCHKGINCIAAVSEKAADDEAEASQVQKAPRIADDLLQQLLDQVAGGQGPEIESLSARQCCADRRPEAACNEVAENSVEASVILASAVQVEQDEYSSRAVNAEDQFQDYGGLGSLESHEEQQGAGEMQMPGEGDLGSQNEVPTSHSVEGVQTETAQNSKECRSIGSMSDNEQNNELELDRARKLLQVTFDSEGESDSEGDGPPDQEKEVPSGSSSGAWRNRRSEPLYNGSSKTVLEAALEALHSKRVNKISDNAFDKESKRIASLLPQPNAYPPSLYAAKQVVGAEDLEPYLVHTCVNDCMRYDKLPRTEWRLHNDDKCQTCQEPRFVSYETQKGTCYKPRKTLIEFGVEKALRELWADPEFCKARNGGEERDVNGPDFWGGEYADEINGRVGGLLFEAENGGYELGFDYGQPYKRQKYSLGVVCIRSLDLPGERRSEKRFRKTVAIFPGPNEPKWLWPYFQGILTESLVGWKRGIRLVDSYTQKAFQHHFFLCLVSSDLMARNALLEHVGVMAFLGCGKCWFAGCRYEGCGNGMYFLGYAKPAPQRGINGAGILAKDARNRTHEEHLKHGRAVETGLETEERSGVKGVSCIASLLSYFDVTKGLPIAVGHALLLGVVKAFLDTVLADYKLEADRPEFVVRKADRRLMSVRHARIVLTHEHGRPGKDVIRYRGSLTMEELLVFVETSSLYILRGCLSKRLETAWFHLRRAVMHYCRINKGAGEPSRRLRAREDMATYARIVEEVIISVL